MKKKFKIKIFADGADLKSIKTLNKINYINGFTTNPSLMKKAGVKSYKKFALEVMKSVKKKPVSFEVFADSLDKMEAQAREIASWGRNIFVKIPITNSKGEKTVKLIKKLNQDSIKCNVTAVFTLDQVKEIYQVSNKKTDLIISVFAGRIADAGIDPIKTIQSSVNICKSKKNIKILWASTRELYNIFQAEKNGCQIITVPHSMLGKLNIIGKNLNEYSIETVKDFYNDAQAAGYEL